MSVFDARREQLDDLEFKHGRIKGRLVAVMDALTDAQVTIAAHAAYCKRPRDPARPTRDIEQAVRHLDHAKELVADLIERAGRERDAR